MTFFESGLQCKLIKALDSDDPSVLSNICPSRHLIKYYLGEPESIPGSTLLQYACSIGALKVTELLLSLGANPNSGRSDSKPIVLACCNNHVDCVAALLDAGADPNPTARVTPLMMAIGHGSYELFRVLLEAGADPRFVNKDGRNPVTAAANKLNREFVGELLRKGCPALGNSLLIPVEKGHVELVRDLISAGADANYINTGHDPLRLPMTLLERAIHERALNRLRARSYLDIIKALLAGGADLNKIAWTRSPLNTAAHHSDLEVAEALLKAGADPNGISLSPFAKSPERSRQATPQYFNTALHEAAQGGAYDLAALLLVNGADTGRRDHEGKTPLDVARERGHIKVVELLQNSDKGTPL